MSSTKTNEPMVIQTGDDGAIYSVAFDSDGMQLLGGQTNGLRRWRVVDGKEVGSRTGMNVDAISVSRDGKWIVFGTAEGASVWDAKMQEKAIEAEVADWVNAVDISPDSTRFATTTGSPHYQASVWDIITGERLVGPLKHDSDIKGIKFSPNGERIATAVGNRSIRVFDSRNGDPLVTINLDATIRLWNPMTPLAWSSDGQQIFATSSDRKIKSFDVSTGSQLAQSQVHGDDEVVSIALAANGKFLATFAERSISFWDTSTLTQIGPVIEDSQKVRSIALSPDCSYLATGGCNGNITIRNLSNIFPDLYGPFHAMTREEAGSECPKGGPEQQDRQPSASEVQDNEAPDSSLDQPATSSPPGSEAHSGGSDNGLLEVELPSSTPGPLFDYDEPPSPASSTGPREVERSLQIIPHLPGPLPMTSPAEPEKHRDAAESPRATPVFKRWLQMRFNKTNKTPASQPPERRSKESGRLVDLGFNSQSQPTVDMAKKGPSRMAAARSDPRTLARPVNWGKKNTKAAKPSREIKNASSSGQGSAGALQQANEASQPSAVTGVHVTEEAGEATVSVAFKFNLPAWMLCLRSGTGDGKH